MLGLLFAGEGLVPSAKVPLRTQQALGPLKARAVTTEMSALRTAAIIGVSARPAIRPRKSDSLTDSLAPQVPVAVGGYLAVSKVLGAKKEEAPEVANFRASLAGMSDLEELSAMSLDQRERGDARTVGDWKEIIMADGRTYYRNVGDGVDRGVERWSMPDEFKALQEAEAEAAL